MAADPQPVLADTHLSNGGAFTPGALVLDEGDFQAPEPGPAWPTEKDWWKEYCALAGGLCYHIRSHREGSP